MRPHVANVKAKGTRTQSRLPPTAHSAAVGALPPIRATLADALRRLRAANIPLDGAADHGVSEALYLRDPDNNGVELYHDRPESHWPRTPTGDLAMHTRPLDLDDLLAEPAPA